MFSSCHLETKIPRSDSAKCRGTGIDLSIVIAIACLIAVQTYMEYIVTRIRIQSVRCKNSLKYPKADTIELYPEWIYWQRILRVQRVSRSVKRSVARPMYTADLTGLQRLTRQLGTEKCIRRRYRAICTELESHLAGYWEPECRM